MDIKMIDALLDADKMLTEGWGEARATGSSRTFEHMLSFMDVDRRYNETILGVFISVRDNKKLSTNDKWHALEGLAANLGSVACKLGFIDKYRVTKEGTISNLFAVGIL